MDLANLCLVVFVAVVAVGLLGINSSILQLAGGIAGLAWCVLVVVGNHS